MPATTAVAMSPVSPALSQASLDITRLVEDATLPSLLSESFTVHSSSSESTLSTAPSFPLGRSVSLSPLVNLTDKRHLLSSTVNISVPTAPRLKVMQEEHLSVRKWADTLIPSIAPGHSPWSEMEDKESVTWVPEGSLHSPETYKIHLAKARALSVATPKRSNFQRVQSVPPPPSSPLPPTGITTSSPARRASLHPNALRRKSFRNAQVFEKEITLNTEGSTKRWSMDIAPNTVRPEMLDIVMSLHDLASFFKDGIHDLTTSVSAITLEKEKLESPPLLGSESPFPSISDDSLESQVPDTRMPATSDLVQGTPPSNLALRRGQRELPPLTFKLVTEEGQSYPSIPTAFLGTPSYVPDPYSGAEVASPQQSLPFHVMINNLQAQCKSLAPQTPTDNLEHVPLPSEPSSARILDGSMDQAEDEWSFAHQLMEDLRSRSKAARDVKIHDSPKDFTEVDNLAGIGSTYGNSAEAPTSPPHCSLPPVPRSSLSTESSSPTLSVRGILKNQKNVRFASLPGRRETAPSTEGTTAPSPSLHPGDPPQISGPGRLTPRHSTGNIRKPSPLRSTISNPASPSTAERKPTRLQPKSRQPAGATGVRPVSRKPPPKHVPASPVRHETFQLESAMAAPQSCSAPPAFNAARPKPRPMTVGVAAGRVISAPRPQGSSTAEKENSPNAKQPILSRRRSVFGLSVSSDNSGGGGTSDGAAKKRMTLAKMDGNRGDGLTPPSSQKSKMPVPLRNIFTRFK